MHEGSSNDDLLVLVPAFNEEQVIAATVAQLFACGWTHVVVIDDGSSDATARVAREAGAVVLQHAVNLGQGAALETGFTYARRAGARYVCTFDADGQHDPHTIAGMLNLARSGYDVVLGSRFVQHGGDVPPIKRAVLRAAVAFTRFHTRLPVTDTHNGLRVLGPKALASIVLRHPGMAHASELLAVIAAEKLRWTEVPTKIQYSDYSKRKGQRLTNSFRILFELFYEGVTRR